MNGRFPSPIADWLGRISVPYLFHTSSRLEPQAAYPHIPIIDKPTQRDVLVALIKTLVGEQDWKDWVAPATRLTPAGATFYCRTIVELKIPWSSHRPKATRWIRAPARWHCVFDSRRYSLSSASCLCNARRSASCWTAQFSSRPKVWKPSCAKFGYFPEDNRMLMRAGVGWNTGLIDIASVGADLESLRLRTARASRSFQITLRMRNGFVRPSCEGPRRRRAINVILQGDGAPFGVLEVDSRSEGEFGEGDIAFLQGAANILGMAIERQRYERSLRRRLSTRKCSSTRSTIGSKTACSWSLACSTCRRRHRATRFSYKVSTRLSAG